MIAFILWAGFLLAESPASVKLPAPLTLMLFALGMGGLAYVLGLKLTRLKAENLELRRTKACADAANSAKDQFLAHMSHEIRTPMTSILGFAELLLEPDQTPAERNEALQSIRRNASHLSDLINNVLDLSKIQAGQMSVQRVECDLPELIHTVIGLTRQTLLDKGLGLQVMNDGPLPSRIETDPLRVRQILVNLISNAGKFTDAGGIELRVSCRPGANPTTNCTIRFEVRDTGIGMTPQQVSRLFQPFAQADESTARRFGGTGLGLVISKSLAGLLGGDINVRSEPGIGSTFTVEIDGGPIDSAATIHSIQQKPGAGPTPPTIQTVPKLRGRVLLAEDGPDNQRLIALRLRQAGARVTVAENGQTALDCLAAAQFDLVLMDLQMPVLDGHAAVTRLRGQGNAVPVIALTARASCADRDKCIAAGFDGYLTKPIDKLKLWECLRQYLQEPTCADEPPLVSELSQDAELKELLKQFVQMLPGKVHELEQLLLRRDATALRQFAHQLNGAAGGYGFPDITRVAAQVENLILDGAPWDSIMASATSLAALIRRVDGYQDRGLVEERPAA